MKKLVIIFIINIVILSILAVGEGFYIAKCRNNITKFQKEISELQAQNKKEENNQMKNELDEEHPINIRQQECMKKQNYTTAAMANCTYAATDEWSKEIDTYIVLIKPYMTPQQYELLIDSQDKWKAYEKAERQLYKETIGTFVGTMYIPILAGMQEDIVEHRARDLSSLYHYMSDENIMKN